MPPTGCSRGVRAAWASIEGLCSDVIRPNGLGAGQMHCAFDPSTKSPYYVHPKEIRGSAPGLDAAHLYEEVIEPAQVLHEQSSGTHEASASMFLCHENLGAGSEVAACAQAEAPSCAAQSSTHLVEHRDKHHVVRGGWRGALQEEAVKIPVTCKGRVGYRGHPGGWPCRASGPVRRHSAKAGTARHQSGNLQELCLTSSPLA